MLNYKTKIGYISKSYDENKKPCDFKLYVEKIKRINIGKTKTTYKIENFRNTYEEDEITSLENMKSHIKHGLILTSELFVIDDEIQEYLQKVVDDWNENGTAKGLFDD